MSYDINQDPALPDWDEDAELTPEEELRARDSRLWAWWKASHSNMTMETCEREARVRRLAMTPAERTADDHERAEALKQARPEWEKVEQDYWTELAEQCGLTKPNPTREEALAAHREWARKRHAMFAKLTDKEAAAVLKREGLFQST